MMECARCGHRHTFLDKCPQCSCASLWPGSWTPDEVRRAREQDEWALSLTHGSRPKIIILRGEALYIEGMSCLPTEVR